MKKSYFSVRTIAVAVAAAQLTMFDITPVMAGPVLEEVIVTARKREESLMDAPISVAAVSGELMDNQGVSNLEQLSAKVPGLQIGRGAQTSSIFIRGIGSGVNKGFEQSAGMYVDGIYQSRSRQFTQSLVDLQQVEVLRGPQGTLFGKNTIAGAIKIETASARPGDEFEGSIGVDYEPDQEMTRSTVVLSGSPVESVGARLAIRHQESDGYVKNNTFNTDVAAKEDTMARLSLAWDATDNLSVEGKLSYVDMKSKGIEVVTPAVDASLLGDVMAGNSALGLTSVVGSIAALAVPGYVPSSDGKEYESWSGNTRYNDGESEATKSVSTSLRFDWDLGQYELTGLTGYSDFEFMQDHDTDFHGGNVANNVDQETLEQFSQELRIASNFDGAVNFIAGVYYEDQSLVSQNQPYLDGSLGGVFGALPGNALNPAIPEGMSLSDVGINSLWNGAILAPGTPLAGTEITDIWRHAYLEQETQTAAIFGEVGIDLSEALTLELGLRYSQDTKKAIKQGDIGIGSPSNPIQTYDVDGNVNPSADPLQAALSKAIWGGLLSTHSHNQNLSREEEHLDPAVKLRWHATEDTMAYMSWSKGYKSGGFNGSADTSNPDGTPGEGTEFDDESAEAWELGLRTTPMDGRARFSATAFQTELANLQVTSFVGISFKVGNAAQVTVKGLEFDTQFAVTEDMEVGAAVSYLDHQFDSYADAPATIVQQAQGLTAQDLSGQRGPYAPKFSGTVYADYSTQVSNNLILSARMDVNFKDEFYTDGDLDPASLQDAYAKIDARLGLSTVDERWEVAIYGRNLTDEATKTASLDAPLSAGIMASWIEEPRVIGAQVRFNF